MNSSQHGTVTADFSDTFKFDPNAFFDIRTPGVTANSPTLGIVNNKLSIPEPATAAMSTLGAVLLISMLRVRQSVTTNV